MQAARITKAAALLFVSAKTTVAVPASCDDVKDALVQASLDPSVRSIEFIPSARVCQTSVDLNAIVVVRDDGRFLLDVVAARPSRDAGDEGLASIALKTFGLPTIILTSVDIRRDPRFENARLVWGYRHHPVGIGLRMRILQVLTDDGPMALINLLKAVQCARDPSPAVMSLACANLIELDLVSRPLGPMTMARCRA